MNLSLAEENYLKSIYHLSEQGEEAVSTNAIAEMLSTKPASVSDMIKKLAQKHVIWYKKYQGAGLTQEGKTLALKIIRKHRLWEVFLVDKLNFNWDEVHEVAEQLEHIRSPLLIERLDEYLGFPAYDPHGDPIPNSDGEIKRVPQVALSECAQGKKGVLTAVNDSHPSLLKYLDKVGAYIGAKIEILEKLEFDGSMEVKIDGKTQVFFSKEIATNILISV